MEEINSDDDEEVEETRNSVCQGGGRPVSFIWKYCSKVAKVDEPGFDVFCDICKNAGVKPVTKYSMKKGM